MSQKTDSLLAEGLKQGFAGGTVKTGIKRTGFSLDSSHLENEEGIYHDEWFAMRAGGGQEIVRVGETTYTRVYAGGTVPESKLQKLGITIGDIMVFLKKQMLENGDKIRLHTDFEPHAEGDWKYSYKVISKNKNIPLTVGKELIWYKDTVVFEHDFILCPVD